MQPDVLSITDLRQRQRNDSRLSEERVWASRKNATFLDSCSKRNHRSRGLRQTSTTDAYRSVTLAVSTFAPSISTQSHTGCHGWSVLGISWPSTGPPRKTVGRHYGRRVPCSRVALTVLMQRRRWRDGLKTAGELVKTEPHGKHRFQEQ